MAGFIEHETDRFKGILIDVSKQKAGTADFIPRLNEALSEWKSEGKKGVWVTVQTNHAALIPQLTELGFDFHHAKPGYVCLTTWLPEDIPNHIPGYANHYLGVAGFVVNSRNQLLVIKEKYHIGNPLASWKLPGGLADAGEDMNETARREVLEETGVQSEFVCVIAYRHQHNYRHKCSDFYQVCLMRPLSEELKPCPLEIADCQWMDLDEYENLESVSDINKFFVKRYREIMSSGTAIGIDQVLSFDKKKLQNIYSVRKITFDSSAKQQNENVNEDCCE